MASVTLPIFANQLSMANIFSAHIESYPGYLVFGMSALYAGGTTQITGYGPPPYVAAGTIAYKNGLYSTVPSSGQIAIGDFHGSTGIPKVSVTQLFDNFTRANATDYPLLGGSYTAGRTKFFFNYGRYGQVIYYSTVTSTPALTIDLTSLTAGDYVEITIDDAIILGKGGNGNGASGGPALRINAPAGVSVYVSVRYPSTVAAGGGGGGGAYGGGGAGGGNGGGAYGGAGAISYLNTKGANGGGAEQNGPGYYTSAGGGGGGWGTFPPAGGYPVSSPGGGSIAPLGALYGLSGGTAGWSGGGLGGYGGGGGGHQNIWSSSAPPGTQIFYTFTGSGSWTGAGGSAGGGFINAGVPLGLSGNYGGGGGGLGGAGGSGVNLSPGGGKTPVGGGNTGYAITSTNPYTMGYVSPGSIYGFY